MFMDNMQKLCIYQLGSCLETDGLLNLYIFRRLSRLLCMCLKTRFRKSRRDCAVSLKGRSEESS